MLRKQKTNKEFIWNTKIGNFLLNIYFKNTFLLERNDPNVLITENSSGTMCADQAAQAVIVGSYTGETEPVQG